MERKFYQSLRKWWNRPRRKTFILRFKGYLQRQGEALFEPVEDDYIITMFEHQGYWAGVRIRIHYNIDKDEFYCTERVFGR